MDYVINNNTSYDLNQLEQLAREFLPFAQKRIGFNKPPVVNFSSNEQSLKDPLCSTGHYSPSNMEVTVFVDNRHIKDILRSLSHELVHHGQNCRGEFEKGISTQPGYAQNDEFLRSMEDEAYREGNFCLRDWEDGIKSSKTKKNQLNETIYKRAFKEGEDAMSTKKWKDLELNSLLMDRWGYKAPEKLEEELQPAMNIRDYKTGQLEEYEEEEKEGDEGDEEEVEEENPHSVESREKHSTKDKVTQENTQFSYSDKMLLEKINNKDPYYLFEGWGSDLWDAATTSTLGLAKKMGIGSGIDVAEKVMGGLSKSETTKKWEDDPDVKQVSKQGGDEEEKGGKKTLDIDILKQFISGGGEAVEGIKDWLTQMLTRAFKRHEQEASEEDIQRLVNDAATSLKAIGLKAVTKLADDPETAEAAGLNEGKIRVLKNNKLGLNETQYKIYDLASRNKLNEAAAEMLLAGVRYGQYCKINRRIKLLEILSQLGLENSEQYKLLSEEILLAEGAAASVVKGTVKGAVKGAVKGVKFALSKAQKAFASRATKKAVQAATKGLPKEAQAAMQKSAQSAGENALIRLLKANPKASQRAQYKAVRDAVAKNVKGTGRKAANKAAKAAEKGTKEATKKGGKEAAKKGTKEAAEKGSKEAAEKGSKEAAEKGAKEAVEAAMKGKWGVALRALRATGKGAKWMLKGLAKVCWKHKVKCTAAGVMAYLVAKGAFEILEDEEGVGAVPGQEGQEGQEGPGGLGPEEGEVPTTPGPGGGRGGGRSTPPGELPKPGDEVPGRPGQVWPQPNEWVGWSSMKVIRRLRELGFHYDKNKTAGGWWQKLPRMHPARVAYRTFWKAGASGRARKRKPPAVSARPEAAVPTLTPPTKGQKAPDIYKNPKAVKSMVKSGGMAPDEAHWAKEWEKADTPEKQAALKKRMGIK